MSSAESVQTMCRMNLKAVAPFTTRDEEKEHAAMVLEWICSIDPIFDKELKDYLFTDKSIARKYVPNKALQLTSKSGASLAFGSTELNR